MSIYSSADYFPYLLVPAIFSSILNSWLYLAILSVLDAEPVLMNPVFNATAKSAMKVSSVSPDLCDMTAVIP